MAGQRDTQAALLEEIQRQADKLSSSNLNTPGQARVARDLALAFRYAIGGPQPGGVAIGD
jgi:hypothetical protein